MFTTNTALLQLLMNDPTTAKVWQTAFGKDFGGMAQGDDKTGQKGTNSVFVMTHKEIDIAKAAGHKWTYARIVIDYRPQKEDPSRIRIAVGGNLITYKGNTLTRTADLTTSKLLWNSVLSTEGARYMCLDIFKLLPHGSLGLLRIDENPVGPISRMDKEAI